MSINRAAQAISARAVRKSFGEHLVLGDVDLTVTDGTTFALLGPNGAGKTTMVRILSTLIRADAGDIRVGGHDVATQPDAVRALIGVTGQFSAVDNSHRRGNLRLMADLSSPGRTVVELQPVRLPTPRDRYRPTSRMRRRLDWPTPVGNPNAIFSATINRRRPCGRSSASSSPTA